MHVKHHASSCVLHSIKCHHPQIRELIIALIVNILITYVNILLHAVVGFRVFSHSLLFFFSLSFLFLSFGKA